METKQIVLQGFLAGVVVHCFFTLPKSAHNSDNHSHFYRELCREHSADLHASFIAHAYIALTFFKPYVAATCYKGMPTLRVLGLGPPSRLSGGQLASVTGAACSHILRPLVPLRGTPLGSTPPHTHTHTHTNSLLTGFHHLQYSAVRG